MKSAKNNDESKSFRIDTSSELLSGYSVLDFYYEELARFGVDITCQGYYIVGDNICRGGKVVVHSPYAAELLRRYRRDPRIKELGYIETNSEPFQFKKVEKELVKRKVKNVYTIDLTFKFGEYTLLDFYFNELMDYGIDPTLSGYHLMGDNIVLDGEVVCSDPRAADLLRCYRSSEDIRKGVGFITVPYYRENKDIIKIDFSKVNTARTRRFFYRELKSFGVDLRKKGYRITGNDIVKNNELITSNPYAASLLKDYNQMVRKRKDDK